MFVRFHGGKTNPSMVFFTTPIILYAWLTYVFSSSNRHMIIVHNNPREATGIIMSTTSLTYVNQSNAQPLDNNTVDKLKVIFGVIGDTVLCSASLPNPVLLKDSPIPGDQRWYIITDRMPMSGTCSDRWDVYIVPNTKREDSPPKFVPRSGKPITNSPSPMGTVSPPLLVDPLSPILDVIIPKKLSYTWWYEWEQDVLFYGNRMDVNGDPLTALTSRGSRINKDARPSPITPSNSVTIPVWDRCITFYWLAEVLSPSNKHMFIITPHDSDKFYREVVAKYIAEEIRGTGVVKTDDIPYVVVDPQSEYRHYIVITLEDFERIIHVDMLSWKLLFITGNVYSFDNGWDPAVYQLPVLSL